MTAFDEWVDRAKAVRIEDEAARRGIRLRRSGTELTGPCPKCGGDDRFWINPKRQTWGCRQCDGKGDRIKGGDVIELVRHIDGSDFRSACETLTGAPPPKPNGHDASKPHHGAPWIYMDPDGLLYLKVDRFEKNGKKVYPQCHWDGAQWVKGKPKGPKIPYRLPELIDSDRTEPVYICEGEKCADAVAGIGLAATSASEGAGKWTSDLNHWFRDRIVHILPDNDRQGAKHAEQVARNLSGIAREVRIVPLAGLSDGEDVYDWIGRGGTAVQLEEIAATIGPRPAEPQADALPDVQVYDAGDDIEPPPPRAWLMLYQFCRTFLSSVIAPGGVGKTALRMLQYVSLAIGRSLTGQYIFQRCRVLLLSFEDDKNELQRRIAAVLIHHKVDRAELKGWLYYATPKGLKLAEMREGSRQIGELENGCAPRSSSKSPTSSA